ncbi:hypothetical protein D8674_037660 [Pyrus ussuriensis x Pyrus communis]|uniref:Integrase catalytic domain-containing protein n=1 Tax=Pyrus ussuriensis x Pyrus communis TaxID=2448454 RepID=A0A5N5H4G8_9ROSA|nr:hypothetical protein D8674_037660 [Pyrus ussuriensis x Pyrus communis]
MECVGDLKTLRKEIQLDRVYAFLARLDDIFDKVHSDVLRSQPLPSVEEVFSVVRREAQRHATMMDSNGVGNQRGVFSVAMVSRPPSGNRTFKPSSSTTSQPFTRENKDDLKCTFCRQTRHTEDTCFQKHGVLDWFPELKKKLHAKERGIGGTRGGRASVATTPKDVVPPFGDPSHSLLTRTTPSDTLSIPGSMGHAFLASDMEHHTEDCTRMTWIYVMKNKSDVSMVFRSFSKMVATQYSFVIKVLHSDNRGEYIGSELSNFLRDQGILHETTCPHTPQQNGVAERKNRHILETAHALLIGASVPNRFWHDMVTYAVHVINRMPSRVFDFLTPLQVLMKFVPVVSTHTLTPHVFGFSPEGKMKYLIANYVLCSNLAPECQAWVNNIEAIQASTRVEEALKDPKWAVAMDEEMMALHKNDIWEVTKLPKGKKPVGCRWVFTVKYKVAGSVDRKDDEARAKPGYRIRDEESRRFEIFSWCGELVDKGRYQRLVGRLIYLPHTPLDIAYAVSVVSQFMHSPSVDHVAAVMRILAYLKSALGKGILYVSHGHMRIKGFTDAD